MRKNLLPFLMVATLMLTACIPAGADATQASVAHQAATIVAATMEALPSQTPEPTAGPACPQPETGTQLLRNEQYGYCFLFPDGYVRLDPLPYEVCLVLEGPSMACHGANLMIEVRDALGRTAVQVADEKIGQQPQPDPFQRISLTVGGEQAVLVDGLSAVAASRSIFIVHDDRIYDLMFIPWDDPGDEFAALEALYTTVINSFTFVP